LERDEHAAEIRRANTAIAMIRQTHCRTTVLAGPASDESVLHTRCIWRSRVESEANLEFSLDFTVTGLIMSQTKNAKS
jgi:hypothetical protein